MAVHGTPALSRRARASRSTAMVVAGASRHRRRRAAGPRARRRPRSSWTTRNPACSDAGTGHRVGAVLHDPPGRARSRWRARRCRSRPAPTAATSSPARSGTSRRADHLRRRRPAPRHDPGRDQRLPALGPELHHDRALHDHRHHRQRHRRLVVVGDRARRQPRDRAPASPSTAGPRTAFDLDGTTGSRARLEHRRPQQRRRVQVRRRLRQQPRRRQRRRTTNARGYVRAAAGFDVRDSTGNVLVEQREPRQRGLGLQHLDRQRRHPAHEQRSSYANGDHGIDVHNAAGATVVANTVYGNVDSGIEVTTSTEHDDRQQHQRRQRDQQPAHVGQPPRRLRRAPPGRASTTTSSSCASAA